MDEDPSYEVEISREVEPAGDFDEPQIRQAIELLLGRHGCSRAELSIALVDDRRIAELNEQYLDHQGPTDVLSFDLADAGASGIEGQVVVSVETARREAGQRGHAAGAEVLLYCVHGVLHLLGYDDTDPQQAQRMHAAENELLTELGIGPVYGATGQ